jgi:ParB-like chromosome segregation protein Spo0J
VGILALLRLPGSPMDIRLVPLQDLNLALARLRQLPEASVSEKVESLRRVGQLSPLAAAHCDGTLVLIDGFLRYQAALRLGLDALLVAVVTLPSAQMKAQVYLRNRERGLLLLEECRLVQELCDVDHLAQVEIADLLERHKSWVCRRLGMFRSLSPHLLTDGALGGLPGGAIRRLAQLPARNQEQLMAAANRDAIAPADVGALAELFRRAPDPSAKGYVLDHPHDALERARRKAETKLDPRLGEAGQDLLAGLTALRQVGLRVAGRATRGLGALPHDAVTQLTTATAAAERDCKAAIEAARNCLAIARPTREEPS